jgi:hypothetical protein
MEFGKHVRILSITIRITNKPLHGKVEGMYVHIPPTEALVELWQKLADDSLGYIFVYMG